MGSYYLNLIEKGLNVENKEIDIKIDVCVCFDYQEAIFGCYSGGIRNVSASFYIGGIDLYKTGWNSNRKEILPNLYRKYGQTYIPMRSSPTQDLVELMTRCSEQAFQSILTRIGYNPGMIFMGDRMSKADPSQVPTIRTGEFALWLARRGWHVTASPVVSNPTHRNGDIASLCQGFIVISPVRFDGAVRGTASIINDSKLATPELFAKAHPCISKPGDAKAASAGTETLFEMFEDNIKGIQEVAKKA